MKLYVVFFALLIGLMQEPISAYTFEYRNASLIERPGMMQKTIDGLPLKGKKILLLYTGAGIKGGTRSYKISLYQHLLWDGFESVFFLVNNPEIQDELDTLKLPYYLCSTRYRCGTSQYNADVLACLHEVCQKEPIGIVNANREQEVAWGKQIACEHCVKLVLTLHVDNLHAKKFLRGIDGVLGVSPQIAQLVALENKRQRFGIKTVSWGAPFFNAQRFLDYAPLKESRFEFFKKNFGIMVADVPIVCMVANFLPQKGWKDHTTLLNAIKKLSVDKKLPVQLLLAGGGSRMKEMRDLARSLGIANQVFFLDYTSLVPDVLNYSDIKVVSSKNEAFCIALLEAALLKKPLIGTRGTGMENIVKHGQTGLLFDKGDADDLADKIALLLNNKSLCRELGEHAYAYVVENYLPELSLKRIETFYMDVLGY